MLTISSKKGKQSWRRQHFLKANVSLLSFNYNFDTKITTRMLRLTKNWVSIHVSLKWKHWTPFRAILVKFLTRKNKKTSPQSIHFKLEFFWYFQRVQKETSDIKYVNKLCDNRIKVTFSCTHGITSGWSLWIVIH